MITSSSSSLEKLRRLGLQVLLFACALSPSVLTWLAPKLSQWELGAPDRSIESSRGAFIAVTVPAGGRALRNWASISAVPSFTAFVAGIFPPCLIDSIMRRQRSNEDTVNHLCRAERANEGHCVRGQDSSSFGSRGAACRYAANPGGMPAASCSACRRALIAKLLRCSLR